MAVFLAVAGVFIIIEALTKSHFANEEGGTARATEQERYRATGAFPGRHLTPLTFLASQ